MTVKLTRTGWMQLYTEMRRPAGFGSRFFTVKPGNFYNGGKVAIDIERYGEDVAIAVTVCEGPNMNDISQFTTKEFTPPAYGEAFPLDVCELLNRMAGVGPYTAAYQSYAADMVSRMMKGFMLVDDKISRAVELQAWQILQTGKLSLTDKDGAARYELDFKPKATHFPTVSTGWDAAGATPYQDVEDLCEVIRADGKVDPDMMLMGRKALRNFLANDEVQKNLDNRRYEVGEIAPQFIDSGATFYGFVWVGNYRLGIWSYPETYKDPQTGDATKYLDDDKVVVLSSRTRLDMTSAEVPLPLGPDPRVESLLPGRLQSSDMGIDVTPNVYPTPNGKQITGELESRPLLIPVQIDGFGCLDTQP